MKQPWGSDKARASTLVSEHLSAKAAFAEIDRVTKQMAINGASMDAIELIVVDGSGQIVERRDVHSAAQQRSSAH